MELKDFYKDYLPVLEEALAYDETNYDFELKDPLFFLKATQSKLIEIEAFLEKVSGKNSFLDKVAYYFDAKTHNFPDINGVDLEDYKKDIKQDFINIKKLYGL